VTPDQHKRAQALVAQWAAEIAAMPYEERKRRREAGLPPFPRYQRGLEALAIHDWDDDVRTGQRASFGT
jgi:hypothetical protein